MRMQSARLARTVVCVALLAGTLPLEGAAQTPQPELPKSQVPTLGRPTTPDDPAPLLDFWRYFKGTWTLTWDYPESPLGPADVLSGRTVYAEKGPATFEAVTEGETTAGTVTITEVFEYDRDAHQMTRTVTDSRGFWYSQTGTVNGDLGGQFTIRLDGAPFTFKGQTVRVNSVIRLLSPYNYRTRYTLSVGSGPFTNYGHPWSRKESTK